ncbi:HEAT repeat domain-containing protein [Phormidium sp. CLA17]|uniref:phycobilisome degradation protein NblB n=1 Tax=Leptolyngbya sp. Cla-17 TaxID=2803751 RepID=UPI001492B97F|nr:HEAT repeat domain-containing protein [Leptolyngbya sp. Cla-17]MBM0743156.1 HEAT repeat domain-containing protein [Leptolyngbya sp. Cla-17]
MDITPDSVKTLLNSADLGDRLRAVNQMRTLDPSITFGMILQAVDDTNARVRYAAVSQLSSLGNQNREKTLETLRDRLQDAEPDVQAAAADSIGALKLTEAFEDLRFLYNTSSEWLVKFSIVAALGELGDPRGFELLEDSITSPNELMQMAAIGSFGELGDIRAVPLLINHVANPDWQVRYRVAQALGRLATPEAKATLETLAQDSVDQVAEEAKSSLA